MYEKGATPAVARQQFIRKLRDSSDNDLDFSAKRADRKFCPRHRDFKSLYTKYVQNELGGLDSDMFPKLVEELNVYQNKNPDAKVKIQMHTDSTDLIIAIVTPLMKRVHEHHPQSKELVFVDSTGNCESHNLKIFLMCTHSTVTALPLGLVVVQNEQESTLKLAFGMLKDCLPPAAFFNQGTLGPEIILTDNCSEEIIALKYTWPESKLLLCLFHILQQVLRWLMLKSHGVCDTERTGVFRLFKRSVYAQTLEEFEERYDTLLADPSVECNDLATQYFEDLKLLQNKFALCYRSALPMRGNQTTNFVEAQFLVLKDVILHRTKEYNVVGLINKLTDELDLHYKVRLYCLLIWGFF